MTKSAASNPWAARRRTPSGSSPVLGSSFRCLCQQSLSVSMFCTIVVLPHKRCLKYFLAHASPSQSSRPVVMNPGTAW
jgi:hypothetical protein